MVGFLEPLGDLIDDDIQMIISDILSEEIDIRLRKHFLKYMFLNINFICKTPVAFQRFAAKSVVKMYLKPGLNIHEQISLDWIIKYQTIYSILETNEEVKEQAPITISGFRVSGGPSMEEDMVKDRETSASQSYNFIFGIVLLPEIIQGILENYDFKEHWIEEGIDILLKCICYPNLSFSTQVEYLELVKLIIESKRFDSKYSYKFLPYLLPSLLIFFRNTLYAKNRSFVINLLNLLEKKVQIDLAAVCFTITDILEKRSMEDTVALDDRKRVNEWNTLLNNLSRFMLNMEPDFSRQNRNFIEEGAKIVHPEVLNIIYVISSKTDRDNIQKIIQDLIMLFGLDPQNAITTFRRSYFLDWIIDLIFRTEFQAAQSPEDQVSSKGMIELSLKLVSIFLECMVVHSPFDKLAFFKVLATIEKKVLSIIKDANPAIDQRSLEVRAGKLRARILASSIDIAFKEDRSIKVSCAHNYHNFLIRCVHYLFGHASKQEIEEKVKLFENEENPAGSPTPDSKIQTPATDKKFSFDELTRDNGEEEISPKLNYESMRLSGGGGEESFIDKCYKYERYREFALIDPLSGEWLDEPVTEAIKRLLEMYTQYSNIEEFISDVNDGKSNHSQELLYRNKQEKSEPKLLSSIVVFLMFLADFSIEQGKIEKLRETVVLFEKVFASVFALTEADRRNLKKTKVKFLDSILVLILYFLSSRRNMLQDSKTLPEAQDILSRGKNRLWKGLILTLKFDKMEKLLQPKDTGGFMKVINVIKQTATAKIISFVDELFFKKYIITDVKKDALKKNVEKVYGNEDFFRDFPEKLRGNEQLKLLIFSNLVNKDTQKSELHSRAETVIELTRSIVEETKQLKMRKKRSAKLRTELEEKLVEIQSVLEENFMTSVINAEMIQRECRFLAHQMLYNQRDINGLWSDTATLRQHSQIDHPFTLDDYKFEGEPNKYYQFELNSWHSHKFSRPFLKLRLLRYWARDPLDLDFGEKDTGEMNIFDRGSNKNRKLKKKYVPTKLRRNMKLFTQRIFNTAASGASKLLSGVVEPKEDENKSLYSRSCELLIRFTIYSGIVIVTKKKLIFCTDNTKSKNYLSILNNELEKHDKVKHTWNLADITEIQRRRLVQRRTGMEIFFEGGYSILINMPPDETDVQEFHDLLMSLRESFTFQNPFSKIRSTRNVKLLEANRYTERWIAGELTNFHYLMILNNYSGRSYHDLSQYPVFPWVNIMYKALRPENIDESESHLFPNEMDFLITEEDLLGENCLTYFEFRNMTKPMGAIGTPSRIKFYQEKFNSKDHFSDIPSYHYGSHYSSPAIVLHYLIRLSPFTEGAKAIQNGHFDLPDRLFFSIVHTFRNAVEETSDVRELIPEFFSVPEFLLNMNKLDLGVSQSGERVDNVIIPKWSQQNPFMFVYIMTKLLESHATTVTLKNWIDLVFGHKQNGEEGEKAMNIFYYLTYEDFVDLSTVKESDRQGIETQVVHFGQTPSRLFQKPHPSPLGNSMGVYKVKSVNFVKDSINIYSKASETREKLIFNKEMKNFHDFMLGSVFRLQSSNLKRVVCIYGNEVIHWQWETNLRSPGEATEDDEDKMPFKFIRYNRQKDVSFNFFAETSILRELDSNLDMLSFPTHMLEENRALVVGGFITGMVIRIYSDKIMEVREGAVQGPLVPFRDRICHQRGQIGVFLDFRVDRWYVHTLECP
jgi:hypothetical protein